MTHITPPENLNNIFDEEYSSHLHSGKIFVQLYKKLYHLLTVELTVAPQKILAQLEELFGSEHFQVLHKREMHSRKKKKNKLQLNRFSYVVQLRPEVLIEIENFSVTFIFGDEAMREDLEKMAIAIKPKQKKKKHKNNFYMLVRSQFGSGFDLQKFNVREMSVDIENNYNDDFANADRMIQSFLNDEKRNGITMLHGKYGTGKSSYIRHLIKNVNKRFIYLPLNLMYEVSSPDILNFFSEYRDSILILEDCEELIKPRNGSNSGNQALVNLLNIGDGLLSDALAFKLICTFNADLKQIDPAIMRRGRLAVRYEFKPLSVEKAKALADKHQITMDINAPVTIADIFNQQQLNDDGFDSGIKVGF